MYQQLRAKRAQNGFTLIELLISIVVVGILAAVVIVGIGSLTDRGEKSACQASMDAAKAASVVYFANNNTYADAFEDLTASPAVLEVPTGVTAAGTSMSPGAGSWAVTLGGGGANPTTFTGCA
jgi:prepilin-type N-terminal cleavage/methylation domain-containing protein